MCRPRNYVYYINPNICLNQERYIWFNKVSSKYIPQSKKHTFDLIKLLGLNIFFWTVDYTWENMVIVFRIFFFRGKCFISISIYLSSIIGYFLKIYLQQFRKKKYNKYSGVSKIIIQNFVLISCVLAVCKLFCMFDLVLP